MNDHDHKSSENSCSKSHCGCCGPIEFEFPEELMTPELKKMKESMSPEEFAELMKALGI